MMAKYLSVLSLLVLGFLPARQWCNAFIQKFSLACTGRAELSGRCFPLHQKARMKGKKDKTELGIRHEGSKMHDGGKSWDQHSFYVYDVKDAAAAAPLRFFATCPRGLEPLLARELGGPDVRADSVKETIAGAEFEGDLGTGYRAALWCRTAHKVLHLLAARGGGVRSRGDLYELAAAPDWPALLGLHQTLAVDTVASRPSQDLSHTHYTALNVKNAVVDRMRAAHGGRRPSVDFGDADLPLLIFIQGDKAKLYRSLNGVGSMHKRGYRESMHKASLKENLAAGLLLASGWDPSAQALCDPMCGSGTLAIEAALLSARRAPGLLRLAAARQQRRGGAGGRGGPEGEGAARPPALARWPDFDREAWEASLSEAAAAALPRPLRPIMANDIHPGAIALAKRDAKSAGVFDFIDFSHTDAQDYKPQNHPDFVITNPPWDQRLNDDAQGSWEILAEWLETNAKSSAVWVYTGNNKLAKTLVGVLKPTERWSLSQGGTDTSLFRFEGPDYVSRSETKPARAAPVPVFTTGVPAVTGTLTDDEERRVAGRRPAAAAAAQRTDEEETPSPEGRQAAARAAAGGGGEGEAAPPPQRSARRPRAPLKRITLGMRTLEEAKVSSVSVVDSMMDFESVERSSGTSSRNDKKDPNGTLLTKASSSVRAVSQERTPKKSPEDIYKKKEPLLSSTLLSNDSIDGMTVPQLKTQLRIRNLKVAGVKGELQSRLKEYIINKT